MKSGAAKARAVELLEQFDLADAADRTAKTYSEACAAGSTWPRRWSSRRP